MQLTDEQEAHFWNRVAIPRDAITDCWLWTAGSNGRGYGQLSVGGGRREAAHRVAYQLVKGEIPRGLVLDHLCRVTACVNPAHLEAVTSPENIRRGVRPRGETHGGAKLSAAEVIAIRAGAGATTQAALARRFGVSKRLIGFVVRREKWVHL